LVPILLLLLLLLFVVNIDKHLQVRTVGAGSFIGEILEYEDERDRRVSDVERLVSELDSRLCLETNSTDAFDDDTDVDDDDDDDDDEANLPSQVTLQHL